MDLATLPDLLTPEELARFLRVSKRTIEDWRRNRTGPVFVKVGRGVRYRPSDVEKWLKRS